MRTAGPNPIEERWLGAALAAIFHAAKAGPEAVTDVLLLRSLDRACKLLQVPAYEFDECARLLDFHYHAAWDCYLGRKALAEAKRLDDAMPPRVGVWHLVH